MLCCAALGLLPNQSAVLLFGKEKAKAGDKVAGQAGKKRASGTIYH